MLTGCVDAAVLYEAGVLSAPDTGVTTGFGLVKLPIELGGYFPVLIGDIGSLGGDAKSVEEESDGLRPMIPFGPFPVTRLVL